MNTRTMMVLVAGLAASPAALAQSYQIQALPPLPGWGDSLAVGVNESGVVVGVSRSGSTWRLTRWTNGVPSDLGTLPNWLRAIPTDISTDGKTIIGEVETTAGATVPFVWEDVAGSGVITEVPGPARTVAGCWQINDSGVIAGRAYGASGPADGVACKWEKSGSVWVLTELPSLPGMGAGAFGISNAGTIAGFSGNSWSGGQVAKAVRWNPGTPAILPGFAAGSTATSFNSAGHFVGDFEVVSGGNWRAYYHNGVAPVDLGTLAYPNSYAHRINDSGTIIGQSYADGVDPTGFPNDNKRAIIWRAGTMAAVNDLIPTGSGWDVKQLWDLNSSGRISGYGRFNGGWRGCLLIPICYANCDASTAAPVLNVNDFSCFLNTFAAGSSNANCDGSTAAPILNVNDFSCFLNKFAAGCQ